MAGKLLLEILKKFMYLVSPLFQIGFALGVDLLLAWNPLLERSATVA